MRVFGKPEFLNLYFRHFAPYLRGINIDAWNLSLHLLLPADMPTGMQGATRDRFVPPGDAYISLPEVEGVSPDTLFQSKVPTIAHEIGHFIHTAFMGKDGSEKWQEWAELSGNKLDFEWTEKHSAHPYPVVPSYEDFAWDFAFWLQGKRWHMERFYMSLWGQEAKATTENIAIFKKMIKELGKVSQERLRELIEKDNPRALLYL